MPYIGKSPSAGVRQRYQYTATAGQTTFSGTDLGNLTLTYTDNNFVDVFQNGVLLKGGGTDYTATSGTSVVLTTGASVSDVIEIIVYDVFSVGNFFNRTDSDSRYYKHSLGEELILDADGDTSITADTDDQIDFKIGGSDKVTIDSSGNVGIGTTSPGRIAELKNTSNPALRLNNGTDVADIGLATSAGALVTGSSDGALVLARGGANVINLGTNGTNRFTIGSSGDVTIADGNLVVASGHGIDFSATSDNAGMEAELLDNYEEGTFTPAFVGASSGITYTTQTGRYTLIGDLCTVFITMSYTLSGFSGSNLRLNIPFTGHASLGQDVQGGVLNRTSGLADTANTANDDNFHFGIYNGASLYIYQFDGNVKNSTSSFQDGNIAGSFTYKIA